MKLTTTAPSPGRTPKSGESVHRLLVLFSPGRRHTGTSAPLLAGRTVRIGREGSEGALVLEDAHVSRGHAEVEPGGEGAFRIRDLGSRNGTFVNGERITESPLADGDALRIGEHVLLFQHLSAPALSALLDPTAQEESPLIGASVEMHATRAAVARLAPLEVPVLILGESGVGKELVAAELHARSGRRGRYVTLNCAAVAENLAESELFGHAKGAFTGATASSHGLFGEAHGGTLFLDEIGEMPLPLQAKLLRALSTGEVRAVGETTARRVDARIVAATNVDLERAVDDGRFRGDLFARLNGATVAVAPLRARRQDVLLLVEHFLSRAGRRMELTADAAEALVIDRFRFNVRELEQVVRLAASHAGADVLDLELLPERFRAPFASRKETDSAPAAEQAVPLVLRVPPDRIPDAGGLRLVLEHFRGNVSHVAGYFRRSRRQVHRWADDHGIDLSTFRDSGDSGDSGDD